MSFLIQHVDSLIMTTVGVCWSVYAARHKDRVQTGRSWFVRKSYGIGLALVLCGVLLFLSETFRSASSYTWSSVSTNDGRASADFPAPVTTQAATDTGEGVSVRRVSTICDVPRKDISLRLSWSEIPAGAPALNVEQRIEAIKGFFQQQGFVLSSCHAENQGDVPCYRLVMDKDGGKVRLIARIAITAGGIYRAVAVSTSGSHDDAVTGRFIDSFTIR
jgi:hypothetical protein